MKKPANDNIIDDEILNILSKFNIVSKKNKPGKHRNILLLGAVCFFMSVMVLLFYHQQSFSQSITPHELKNLKADARIVAKCENKSLQKLYWELKKKFNFYRFQELTTDKYSLIMENLNQRNCEK